MPERGTMEGDVGFFGWILTRIRAAKSGDCSFFLMSFNA